jgi:hypothetical protein
MVVPNRLSVRAVILLWALAAGACSDGPEPEVITDWTLRETRRIPVTAIGSVSQLIRINDSLLVVRGSFFSPYYARVDLTQPTRQLSFGFEGEGPGELRSSGRGHAGRHGQDQLWVYEGNRAQFTRYSLRDSVKLDTTIVHHGRMLLDVVFTSRGMVGIGMHDGVMEMTLADSLQRHAGTTISGQPYTREKLESVDIFDANDAFIATLDDGETVAIAYRFAPLVQFVDRDGNEIARYTVAEHFAPPRRDPESPNPGFSTDLSEVAFTAIAPADGGIVATYCGCVGSEADEHQQLLLDLRVTGGLQRTGTLPRAPNGLASSADRSRIWVGSMHDTPTILEFRGTHSARRLLQAIRRAS